MSYQVPTSKLILIDDYKALPALKGINGPKSGPIKTPYRLAIGLIRDVLNQVNQPRVFEVIVTEDMPKIIYSPRVELTPENYMLQYYDIVAIENGEKSIDEFDLSDVIIPDGVGTSTFQLESVSITVDEVATEPELNTTGPIAADTVEPTPEIPVSTEPDTEPVVTTDPEVAGEPEGTPSPETTPEVAAELEVAPVTEPVVEVPKATGKGNNKSGK